jgi:uncharacterized repeat protein (TIGR03803 family)
MKYWDIGIGTFLSSVLLAGCANGLTFSSPTSGVPGPGSPLSVATSVTEKILYRFEGGKDGANPESALINLRGTLFGTTQHGGGATCAALNSPPGCGTIFRINTSGAGYTVIHRYPKSARDGSQPVAGVINVGGRLYGTTSFGDGDQACMDNGGCGTIFGIDLSGKRYGILHKFDGTDGLAVFGGVVAQGDILYGATFLGGAGSCACGVAYAFSLRAMETTVHAFAGGAGGDEPFFGPIDVNGTLYGTTMSGGDVKCRSVSGCGIIYAMRADGKRYRILHSFRGGTDGAIPNNVIDVDGTLYGTTAAGGGTSCRGHAGPGCGTIFQISAAGKRYRVLYRFKGGDAGWDPTGLSADEKGTLYGATSFGGDSGCAYGYGCGTIFSVNAPGKEYRVLYRFKGGMDGANPYLYGPVEANGVLYGTTYFGGGPRCGGSGCGTVFAVTL